MSPAPKFRSPRGEVVRLNSDRSRILATMPVDMEEVGLLGMVSKFSLAMEDTGMVLAPPDAEIATLARLLAILLIGEKEPVLEPAFMPSRPATAYVLSSGEMRQMRGRRFAPWVTEEVARVAEELVLRHREYVYDVRNALRGSGAFASTPQGFMLQDDTGQMRVGPPPPAVAIDLSRSERAQSRLEWYQVVSLDYQRNRYLTYLSDQQLLRRFEDIFGNIHILNDQGQVSIDRDDASLPYWFSRFQEVTTEGTIRYGGFPAGGTSGIFDHSRLPESLNSAQLARHQRLGKSRQPGPVLVKYGRRVYVGGAYDRGLVRIAPASLYDDASLNNAIRDDELSIEIDFDPAFSGIDRRLDDLLHIPSREVIRHHLDTNYYVYCTSMTLSTRLLLDFEAEAALLIHEPDIFIERLYRAAEEQLSGWECVAEPVQYYDPMQVAPAEVEVLIWKHFRYAYQREFRIAWLPKTPVSRLEPISLELGSLRDIAEVCVPEAVAR